MERKALKIGERYAFRNGGRSRYAPTHVGQLSSVDRHKCGRSVISIATFVGVQQRREARASLLEGRELANDSSTVRVEVRDVVYAFNLERVLADQKALDEQNARYAAEVAAEKADEAAIDAVAASLGFPRQEGEGLAAIERSYGTVKVSADAWAEIVRRLAVQA
jgi:hypothetical protein